MIIFWLVLRLEISYNRVVITSSRILVFFLRITLKINVFLHGEIF
jgi:hypothetical protein